jgi:4,5-DOPA dioxygenase extradiol
MDRRRSCAIKPEMAKENDMHRAKPKASSGDERNRAPVLFIGHGSPINAIANNDYTRCLARLGETLPKPRAILVISAHWLTRGTCVTSSPEPKTIHDFYGFPKELFNISYPAPGDKEVADRVVDLGGGQIRGSDKWGLDHGAWTVLKHMYPRADVPILELSIDYQWGEWNPKPLRYHYDLAKRLSTLRDQGVMIMGSGNLVHNLGLVDWNEDSEPFDWAEEFDEVLRTKLMEGDHDALLDHRALSQHADLAIPTLDHYLPMVYAIGMQGREDGMDFVYEGFQNASISMRCFIIH